MMKNETSRIRPKPRKNPLRWVIVLLLILVYVWALAGVPFTGFKETAAQIMKAIVAGIFSPDWDFVYLPEGEDLLRGLLDTLAISVLGTVISAVLCIPFAFWSARNMSGHRSISGAGKMVLSFIRTFPEIIMALLFIKAVGQVRSQGYSPLDYTPSACWANCTQMKSRISTMAHLRRCLPLEPIACSSCGSPSCRR